MVAQYSPQAVAYATTYTGVVDPQDTGTEKEQVVPVPALVFP